MLARLAHLVHARVLWRQATHYRFSIAWARLLPTGAADNVNLAGVRYYNNLIDELLANNIKPVVRSGDTSPGHTCGTSSIKGQIGASVGPLEEPSAR